MNLHRWKLPCRRQPLRPSASPLGRMAAAFGASCMLTFPFTGWVEALAAGIVLIVLFVMAAVMSRGTACGEIALSVSTFRLAAGEHLDVNVDIANHGNGVIPAREALLPVGSDTRRFRISRLRAGKGESTRLDVETRSRGIMDIGPVMIHVGDPLGLMGGERSLGDVCRVFVHPRTVRFRMSVMDAVHDLDGDPSGHVVDDDLEFHGLREYRPGDDLRGVHWLSTSRVGKLMVRQYDASRRGDIVLVMDADRSGYADDAEFELAVSVFASIGAQCLLSRRPLIARTGVDCVRPRRADEFLDFCSGIAPIPSRSLDENEPSGVQSQRYRTFALGSPPHALRCVIIGSLHDPIDGTREVTPGSACLVVQTQSASSTRNGRRNGDAWPRSATMHKFAVERIRDLDELPGIMEALS